MATVPSVPFFGILDEDHLNQLQQQSSASTPSSSAAAAPQQAAPLKKKRNLPGTPYPDAEVVALSPKTLMATNRFVCDVCNKGFQREQNLQLHRRGHNLPWKLKRKSAGEVRRRRVYLCPEPTCAHHDPSRALGDLTGIKKHFSRKHGEKKWKCDKCSKRYAVQSDWRAHSKVCGTREYRCDCGTLFSRRDSFITHRAFCDALAQESSRLPTGLNPMGSHLYGNSSGMGLGLSQLNLQISSLQDQSHPSADLLRLGGGGGGVQFDHLIPPSNPSSIFYPGSSSQDFSDDTQSHQSFLQTKPFHGLMHLPDIQSNSNVASSASAAAANLFNLSNNAGNPSTHLLISDQFNNAGPTSLFSGALMSNQMSGGPTSLYNTSAHNEGMLPQMSATALLQKAAQMGARTSDGNGSSLLRGYGSSSSNFRASFGGGGGGESLGSQYQNETNLQGLMNSLSNGGGGGRGHELGFGGFGRGLASMDESKLHQNLTRDFLGVGSMVRSMGRGVSQREQHHGVDMDLFDAEMKPASSHRSFSGGNLQ